MIRHGLKRPMTGFAGIGPVNVNVDQFHISSFGCPSHGPGRWIMSASAVDRRSNPHPARLCPSPTRTGAQATYGPPALGPGSRRGLNRL